MTAEQRYRSALRWYPRSWRRANEDVVVGTLLDVADGEGRVSPSREELRDLRRSGLGARADVLVPRPVRDRVSAISLGAGAAFALALLTGQLWSAWAPTDSQWPQAWLASSPELVPPDGVVWQVLIHPGLWILGAVAALTGWTVVSRVLLIVSIPASILSVIGTDVYFTLRPSLFTLVMMSVLGVLACTGRAPRRWQLSATGITAALIASWLSFLGPYARTYFPRGGLIDLIGSPWPSVLLMLAAVVALILRRRIAAASVMIAAAPWLVAFIGQQLWFYRFTAGLDFVVGTVVTVAISVVIPLAIAVIARRYARAPWHSPSESSDSPTSASRPSSMR